MKYEISVFTDLVCSDPLIVPMICHPATHQDRSRARRRAERVFETVANENGYSVDWEERTLRRNG